MPNTDAFPVTPGTGRNVGVDHDLTMPDAAVADVQAYKLALGRTQILTAFQAGRDLGSGDGAAYVDIRRKLVSIAQTPTITSGSAYAVGNAIGGLLTFANAARASGFPGGIRNLVVTDASKQNTSFRLLLFSAAPTAPTDKTAYNPSAADLALCVGMWASSAGGWFSLANNSVYSDATGAQARPELPFTVAATSLFGVLVSNGTPTYGSTSALTVTLFIAQD